jgi:hypothetical protein
MWGIIGHVTVEAGNTVGTDGAPPQILFYYPPGFLTCLIALRDQRLCSLLRFTAYAELNPLARLNLPPGTIKAYIAQYILICTVLG